MSKTKKTCPNCASPVKGHPNKRFCNSRCKDQHHNRVNPRGYFQPTESGIAVGPDFKGITDQEHEALMDSVEAGWDGHK